MSSKNAQLIQKYLPWANRTHGLPQISQVAIGDYNPRVPEERESWSEVAQLARETLIDTLNPVL